MKPVRRNSSALARNPRSEKQIWNRAMATGALGGLLGFQVARSSAPVGDRSGTRLVVGFMTGFVAGMSAGALAFGAKINQLPRIVFGFPKG